MIVIKVWCLPANQREEDLRKLHLAIVAAVTGVTELGIKNQDEMVCLFPADLIKYSLGEEIIIEVAGLQNDVVRQRLAKVLGEAVQALYSNAKVECIVEGVNPINGFWTSAG